MAFPVLFLHNFLFSGFAALPLAFLTLSVLKTRPASPRPGLYEWSLLIPAAVLFTLTNLAPTYAGWQMRGYWMARLYQPLFVVYLVYLMRQRQPLSVAPPADAGRGLLNPRRVATLVCAAVFLHNAAVVFGPLAKSAYAERVDWEFYGSNNRANHSLMIERLGELGRKPLGF